MLLVPDVCGLMDREEVEEQGCDPLWTELSATSFLYPLVPEKGQGFEKTSIPIHTCHSVCVDL